VTVTMFVSHVRTNFAAAFFPRLSEWLAACVLFALGTVLAANADLMVSTDAEAYQLMRLVAPQSTWSLVLIGFSCIRLIILLVNGAWRRSPHLRALTAFLSCFVWTQIVLSFAPTFGFAFVLACGWLGMDMINIMRAMRDARTIDHAHAAGAISSGQHQSA
jgi:hypothetical protein